MTTADRYVLHGVGLRVRGDAPYVRAAIRARLLAYEHTHHDHDDHDHDDDGDGDGDAFAWVDISLERDDPIISTGKRGRPVYDTEIADVLYDDATDTLTIDAERQVQVVADLRRNRVRMCLLSDSAEAAALCAHPLLTLCLLEAMKRNGRYSLHSGGVATGTDAILIPGASGAGKSTLTVALLQLGTGFLSDDIVFLAPDERGVEVLSFADQLDITDTTAAMFAELVSFVGAPLPAGRPKHAVRAEQYFAGPRVDRARPAAIVLPSISPDRESAVRPADPGELLAHLAPNVLLTDAASSQLHLDALAALVDSVPAYRLAVGSDLGEAARLVLSLIA